MSNSKHPALSQRVSLITESATLKLDALVKKLKAEGQNVVNLTAGEPDFPPFEEAKKAAIEAVKGNQSKYTPVPGIPELRELIAKKTNQQQPSVVKYSPWSAQHVVVSNGGKQALFNFFLSIVDPGDTVLVPSPYWLSYPEMVRIAGGDARVISTDSKRGFKFTPDDLRRALDASTKALVINSPSNPSGILYSRKEFEAIGKVLMEKSFENIWVVSDEIYDEITFSKEGFCSFLEACPELRSRCVTVNGMSKGGAMTGWRIGWTVADEEITKSMIKIQGQTTSGINAIAQWASVAALRLPHSAYEERKQVFLSRRNLMLDCLKNCGKLEIVVPEGAFYFFVGVGQCLEDGEDANQFSQRLLERARVAVVPGGPFGEPNFVRLSFASDEETLREGCRRLVEFVSGGSS